MHIKYFKKHNNIKNLKTTLKFQSVYLINKNGRVLIGVDDFEDDFRSITRTLPSFCLHSATHALRSFGGQPFRQCDGTGELNLDFFKFSF